MVLVIIAPVYSLGHFVIHVHCRLFLSSFLSRYLYVRLRMYLLFVQIAWLFGRLDLFLSQVRQSADRSLFASLRSTESSQSASTSTSGALTEATPSSEQEGEEGDGGHAKVVSTTADSPPSYSEAAAAASESPYKDSDLVCRISLKEFVGVHDLRRFQYAQASLRVTLEASGKESSMALVYNVCMGCVWMCACLCV